MMGFLRIGVPQRPQASTSPSASSIASHKGSDYAQNGFRSGAIEAEHPTPTVLATARRESRWTSFRWPRR